MGRKSPIKPPHASKRCQAINANNERCSRSATFQIDLSKSRKVFGIPIPQVKCCFYCTQHTKQLFGSLLLTGLVHAIPMIVKSEMTDEQKEVMNAVEYL
jgi:hypothetical protein